MQGFSLNFSILLSLKELKEIILQAGKEICGETSGKLNRKRETWWWNISVQQIITEKKAAYKKWQNSAKDADKETYKKPRRQTK